jgi:phosphoribosylpyrophosphate synthetase
VSEPVEALQQALDAEHAAIYAYGLVIGQLTGDALDRLKKADVEEVIVTDTVPIAGAKTGSLIKVLSVAPLLAEAIIRVHENRSVSELFR